MEIDYVMMVKEMREAQEAYRKARREHGYGTHVANRAKNRMQYLEKQVDKETKEIISEYEDGELEQGSLF